MASAGSYSKNLEAAPSYPADVAAPVEVRVLLNAALVPVKHELRVDATFAEDASARERTCLYIAGLHGEKPIGASPVPAHLASFVKSGNGFLAAIHTAYALHGTLRLSPDDVWAPIVASVAAYVDKHAKEMRASFVTFEGKAELVVDVPPSVENVSNADVPWADVVHTFKALIGEHTLENVRAAFEPNFSTTGGVSVVHAGVALMSAMKSFFTYSVSTLCGIREVVLEGTTEDWTALRAKTAALGALGGGRVGADLADWFAVLDGTLAQLETTARGNPSVDYWSHVYSSYRTYGSGASTYFSGWALNFFLFDANGSRIPHARFQESLDVQLARIADLKRVDDDDDGDIFYGLEECSIPALWTRAPVTWATRSGVTRKLTFHSGAFGFGITHAGEIKPVQGWIISEQATRQ
jgi:hypothetical protein